jgi:hypothetical protein
VALEVELTDEPMQRRLKQYVCARILVSLDASGKPDDPEHRALWESCKVGGVPSVAALKPDGTLIASETGPDAENLEALLTKGLEPAK